MTDRYMQMAWLAGDDPVRLSAYERMPMVEYYILLNKKNDGIQAHLRAASKSGRKQ
jgi:hypothetical protein